MRPKKVKIIAINPVFLNRELKTVTESLYSRYAGIDRIQINHINISELKLVKTPIPLIKISISRINMKNAAVKLTMLPKVSFSIYGFVRNNL